MAKGKQKINPKDQTTALRAATLEMLKRNKPVRDAYEKIITDRKGITTRGMIETALVPPAAIGFRFIDPGDADQIKHIKSGLMFYGSLEETAPEIVLEALTSGNPTGTLLLGVDLRRSKEAIMAEIGNLLDAQIKNQGRLKWLPIADDILQVWDMRLTGISFDKISVMLKIKSPTAKKRFKLAFQMITRKAYEKRLWSDMLRAYLGEIAIKEKPKDKRFWNRVMQLETHSQRERVSDKPKRSDDQKSLDNAFLNDDLSSLCGTCPDVICKTEMAERLRNYFDGDENAFHDFQPECPRLYNLLKEYLRPEK